MTMAEADIVLEEDTGAEAPFVKELIKVWRA